VEIARKNALRNGVGGVKIVLSDGFRALDEAGFDLILSNPPYQSDFSVAKHFIEKGFNRLGPGGRMVMVTRRREWYRNKLIAIFGGVKIQEVDGYFVFEAQRRSRHYGGRD
jgi:16S rRNA (guanine1207-N2)-methyltransferase